eukprot:gene1344-4521_t
MGAQPSREILFQHAGGTVQVSEGVMNDLVRYYKYRKGEEELREAYTDLYNEYKNVDAALKKAHNQGFQKGVVIERQGKEQELLRLDLQWQSRLDKVQREREEQTEQQFNEVMSDFRSRFKYDTFNII